MRFEGQVCNAHACCGIAPDSEREHNLVSGGFSMAAYKVDGKSDLKTGLVGLGIGAVWLAIIAYIARLIAIS